MKQRPMKKIVVVVLLVFLVSATGFTSRQSNTEFVCQKVLKAKNECHYNFLVDGGKYRYVDIGCRRKKEDVIKKVMDGEIPLAKDWKIECPMPKKED
jgi:hypothetical protein